MRYEIEFKPRALRDLKDLPRTDAARILERVERMRDDLTGDVKRLTQYTYEYRLRAGDYRVPFGVSGNRAVIWRILHRQEAYDR